MIKETDHFKTDHGYSFRSRTSCQWPWRVKIYITYEKLPNSKYITALVAVCRNIIFKNERTIWAKHFASYQDLFSNLYKMYQLFRIGHCYRTDLKISRPWGYKTWVQAQTQNKAQWLAACGHVSANSQSLRFILSLRMNSSFITKAIQI